MSKGFIYRVYFTSIMQEAVFHLSSLEEVDQLSREKEIFTPIYCQIAKRNEKIKLQEKYESAIEEIDLFECRRIEVQMQLLNERKCTKGIAKVFQNPDQRKSVLES